MTRAILDDTITALDARVPPAVHRVCQTLVRAGHQAVAVGGAVRDAMLDREPGDWDVATSAQPDQVMALFRKTIPTGLQHGTVTVLVRADDRTAGPPHSIDRTAGPGNSIDRTAGPGNSIDRTAGPGNSIGTPTREALEVTTFRGEGAYSDGRRPDSVTFGVPLRDDLARRDFVINAMAYDPVAKKLIDPFDGAGDVARRRIRAVGDPRERFAEDGLRVMRAIRFAAVLEFDLDPATEAAIAGALPVLARVSRERVRDELVKLLAARQPSRGLVIARRTGILESIAPELALPASGPDDDARWQRTLRRIDAADDRWIRLAGLLLAAPGELPPAGKPSSPLRRLKLSNAEIERVDRLLRFAPMWQQAPTDGELRSRLGRLGRNYIADLLALWRAEQQALAGGAVPGDADAAASVAEIAARVRAVVARGDALTIGELAVSGGDLIRVLELKPGPAVGKLLAALHARVLEDPGLNDPDALADLARELCRSQRP